MKLKRINAKNVKVFVSQEELEEKEMTLEDAVSFAKELIESGSKPSEAAKKASELSGIKKADIYKEIV